MKKSSNKQLFAALLTATVLATSLTPALAATYTITIPYTANWQDALNQQLASLGLKAVPTTPTTPSTTPSTTPTTPSTTPTTPSTTPTTTPTATTMTSAQLNANSALLSAPMTADEVKLFNLVNQERTSRGLKALTVDMKLLKVARMKALDMINKNYFSHTSPTYGSPFDLMKAQGITYHTAGENLAGAATVDRAHTLLMNSTGHRANILNSSYTNVGIAVVKGGNYGLMITQEFTG